MSLLKRRLNPSAKTAIILGALCSVCYLAVYFARDILSTVTPRMIQSGLFDENGIGALSSVFFITYAVGQLINGLVGDKIKAKYMICIGLVLAGVCNLAFSLFAEHWTAAYLAYALTGFFLSMIYAPMSKMVTENTKPIYAVRCSIAYGFAAYFGSPMAGVAAAVVSWQGAFGVASGSLVLIGVVGFVLFTAMEKRGQIRYGQFQPPAEKGGGIKLLLKRQIITFMLVAVLTGVVRTTVVFWMPTYFVQYLNFTEEQSALIYTVATLLFCVNSFLAVYLYEKLFRRNTKLSTMVYFVVSAVAFGAMALVHEPIGNIVLMVVAVLAANCASTILWCCYCIGLRDTGMVSGATGFLDFSSYMAASIASTAFAKALPSIGWSGLIVSWFVLMAFGAVITIPYRKKTST